MTEPKLVAEKPEWRRIGRDWQIKIKCEPCKGSGCGDGDEGRCLNCNGLGELWDLS